MIIPYRVDVPYDRRPFINWLFCIILIAVFVWQVRSANQYVKDQLPQQPTYQNPESAKQTIQQFLDNHPWKPYMLDGWQIKGIFGHVWLHGGIIHLMGNLLILWVFGNAICSKIGNITYLVTYITLGLAAAVSHLLFSTSPALGASGAINGIVGMFLVFFPENAISCVFLFFFPLVLRPYASTFTISSYWMILLWFVFDIWGAAKGGRNVAYGAHLGGFATGFVLAILMLKLKWVGVERYEKSLLQLIGLEKTETPEEIRGDFASWQQQYLTSGSGAAKPDTIAQPPQHKPQPPPVKTPDQFVRFVCTCGKRVKVPAKFAGKVGRCPQCQKRLKIPEC